MNFLSLFLSFWLSILPLQTAPATENQVKKTACVQATDYDNVDELKQALLIHAKRFAVNELFGELIAASTAVENFVLTSDQIRSTSMGFVRIDGELDYYNGKNFAETCVTISGYTTEQDRSKFEPLKLRKRQCVTDPDLTTREIREAAKKESVIQALLDYDRNLQEFDNSKLLKLMQRVEFSDSGFVSETETYCTTVEGQVIPIEIIAALEFSAFQDDQVQVTEQLLELYSDSSWLSYHVTSPGWQTLDFDDATWSTSSIVTYRSWTRLRDMKPQANWIWNPKASINKPTLFRKSFEITGQPVSAALHISGDNIYQVYVNGVDVGSDSDWEKKEVYDINPYLMSGKNVIAVQVIDIGAPGGLIAYAEIMNQISSNESTLVNIAENKRVKQSSTGWDSPAERAVDGNTNGDWRKNSVTHTDTEAHAWWRVDLSTTHQIDSIQIWNRTDCCSDRLANFYIFVSNKDMTGSSMTALVNDDSVWRYQVIEPVAEKMVIPVNSTGQFVRIQKANKGVLSLAEVEVYGSPE